MYASAKQVHDADVASTRAVSQGSDSGLPTGSAQQPPSALYKRFMPSSPAAIVYATGLIQASVDPGPTEQEPRDQITAALRPLLTSYAHQCKGSLLQAYITFIPDPAPTHQAPFVSALGLAVLSPTTENLGDTKLAVAFDAVILIGTQPSAAPASALPHTSSPVPMTPPLPTPRSSFDGDANLLFGSPLPSSVPADQGAEQTLSAPGSLSGSTEPSSTGTSGSGCSQQTPGGCGEVGGCVQGWWSKQGEGEGEGQAGAAGSNVGGGEGAGAGTQREGQGAQALQAAPAVPTTRNVPAGSAPTPQDPLAPPLHDVQRPSSHQAGPAPSTASLESHLITQLASAAPGVRVLGCSVNLTDGGSGAPTYAMADRSQNP